MSAIVVKRSHNRGLDAARKEAEMLADELGKKFGLKHRWSSDLLEFKGSGAKGKMLCGEDILEIKLELSFMLKPFKARIEQEINKYLDDFCSA